MVFDLSQLKKIRRQLGLTQHVFARQTGISQSMVAKIESGRLDPAYSKVQQIEKTLIKLTHHEEKKAGEVVTEKVIVVHPDESAPKAVALMKKYAISQVPVVRGEKILGIVYESSFLKKDIEELPRLRIEEIMEESPPFVGAGTPVSVVRQMLQWYSCVLVVEKGKLTGIITRTDVIKSLGNA